MIDRAHCEPATPNWNLTQPTAASAVDVRWSRKIGGWAHRHLMNPCRWHTAGTTGTSKGVWLSRRGRCRFRDLEAQTLAIALGRWVISAAAIPSTSCFTSSPCHAARFLQLKNAGKLPFLEELPPRQRPSDPLSGRTDRSLSRPWLGRLPPTHSQQRIARQLWFLLSVTDQVPNGLDGVM
jgi:hypothetical protein